MANPEKDGSAMLVGRLIRSYRNDATRNGRRLSQDGLVDLMIERGEGAAANLDRSSISRYERGVRLAPKEFLLAFGRAFDIPQGEMNRILSCAGYDDANGANGTNGGAPQTGANEAAPDIESKLENLQRDVRGLIDSRGEPEPSANEAALEATRGIESKIESLQIDVRRLVDSTVEPETRVNAPSAVKNALWRMSPPGVWIVAMGFFLNAMDLNGAPYLLAYVAVALAIAVGHGVLRWLMRGRDLWAREHIVDLFFVSLFFTLNTPALIGALTKADHFGFYTVEGFANTPMPFLFAMLVNLQLALAASVAFSLLWSRRSMAGGGEGALSRAVWITLPPLLFVYVNVVLFTNLGAWAYFLTIFSILFGAFTTIAALMESEAALRQVSAVLKALVAAIAFFASLGFAGTLMGYIDPGMALASAEFRIIPLPEVSPEELGYASEDGTRLIGLGILLQTLAAFVYLAIAVGGHLALTMRRSYSRPAPRPS